MRNLPAVYLSFATALLSACAVGPDYEKPMVAEDVIGESAQWQTAYTTTNNVQHHLSKEGDRVSTQREWWVAFNDPLLNEFIRIARAQNLDLRSASERIREARAYFDGASAELFPELSVSGGAVRRSSDAGSRDGVATTRSTRAYDAGFDASWEIDLFGGLRRQKEANQAELDVVVADRDDVELSLLSEVAKNYIEFRRAQYEHQLAVRTLNAQEKTARITEARYKQGVDGRLELERAQVSLANTRARLPASKAAADAARFQLAFLLAKSTEEINALIIQLSSPEANSALSTPQLDELLALPAEVMAFRPDVRAAERQLAAATARQGVAIAARYPRLTISGLLGLSSGDGDSLSSGESRLWSLNANVLLPLIDFGRRRADIEAADAQQAQALLNYERSVRNAVTDINTVLSQYVREREQLTTYQQATEAARNALTIANKQYVEGILPQLDVLIAERTLFESELSEVQSRASVAERFVALNKALGRGIN